MITLTTVQRLVLIDSLEKMDNDNHPSNPLTKVLGMVNKGVIDPHRMKAEQISVLTESINNSDFHRQLIENDATEQQITTVGSTMKTLVTLLSMYCVQCHFKTA